MCICMCILKICSMRNAGIIIAFTFKFSLQVLSLFSFQLQSNHYELYSGCINTRLKRVCERNECNQCVHGRRWSTDDAPRRSLLTRYNKGDHLDPGKRNRDRDSLAEFHAADEVFTSGTMGELTPVTMIDGRVIGTGMRGAVTTRLQEVYSNLPERPGWSTAIPPFLE